VVHNDSVQATRQGGPTATARTRAEAKITVHRSETLPFDQTPSAALAEIRLSETFSGDIEGESTVRAFQVMRDDRSASMVSVQRFRGTLGGRSGTFVLQGSETVSNGRIRATWLVVPGSGTGELSGLRGDGGFEGGFGQGSIAGRSATGSNDPRLSPEHQSQPLSGCGVARSYPGYGNLALQPAATGWSVVFRALSRKLAYCITRWLTGVILHSSIFTVSTLQ